MQTEMTKPETLYRTTADKAARRRIQAQVVDAHRAWAAETAKALVPRAFHQHLPDAEQACLIGVLVALHRFVPATDEPFEVAALPAVRTELQKFLDVGIVWKKRAAPPAPAPARVFVEVTIGGRTFEIDVRSSDGQGATVDEHASALTEAMGILRSPVEA